MRGLGWIGLTLALVTGQVTSYSKARAEAVAKQTEKK